MNKDNEEKQFEDLIEKYARVVQEGEIIFNEEDEGDSMFFVREGEIEIRKRSGKKDKVIAIFGKGDFFGEISLLTGKPRSATAVARDDSILIEVNTEKFKKMIKTYPDVALEVLRKMAERLYRTDQIVENLLLRDRQSQIINAILQFAKEAGYTGKEAELVFDLEELESRVSVESEVIKKVLFLLDSGGFLKVRENKIIIPNLKRLKDYLNFLEWKEDIQQKIHKIE